MKGRGRGTQRVLHRRCAHKVGEEVIRASSEEVEGVKSVMRKHLAGRVVVYLCAVGSVALVVGRCPLFAAVVWGVGFLISVYVQVVRRGLRADQLSLTVTGFLDLGKASVNKEVNCAGGR